MPFVQPGGEPEVRRGARNRSGSNPVPHLGRRMRAEGSETNIDELNNTKVRPKQFEENTTNQTMFNISIIPPLSAVVSGPATPPVGGTGVVGAGVGGSPSSPPGPLTPVNPGGAWLALCRPWLQLYPPAATVGLGTPDALGPNPAAAAAASMYLPSLYLQSLLSQHIESQKILAGLQPTFPMGNT